MSETNRVEYKQELTDSLEKEVIAFLNYKEGGIIYIGIDKLGVAVGVKDSDSDQLKIKDRLKHNILPSCMGLFDVISESNNGLDIIKIVVASGSEKPYFLRKFGMTEKGCFVRIGTASEPMPQKRIDELFAKRIRNSISKIKSNRQDLTFEQLKIYYEATGSKLNDKFAQNLELINEDGFLNYVAYLLADHNGNSIKLAKYNGINRVNLIENNEYGYCSLIKAAKQVLDKLELENKTLSKITSKERENQRLWNPIALREAVVNAIIHNDYSNEVPPKFEIFDDRIEITSAGGLPDALNQEEFFDGVSIPRNKELMRIFKDLDMVEQLGSGVPRILESYPKECFKFSDNFLRMIFPVAEIGNKVNSKEVPDSGGAIGGAIGGVIGGAISILTERQKEVLEIIIKDDKISYRAIAEQMSINESAVSKHIEQLKEKGYIERIGGTRGFWKVKYPIQ
ncbi:winged helix-turn-helix transcriptional regulator [Flavobacterium sufflavum]|uniref:Winged helix-turn-helix transcriptional regulator n=1 Tax=Flavobacterium sufflavum TaxID=1921138 RepID=A0A3S2XLX2_9FLAO|nr:RNA-binding domain-containing protein [Flavobacterium sufflavum]RVT79654.1 winged helix-turn-helix transcriptional regulator [Flavobacterium sufflavum]